MDKFKWLALTYAMVAAGCSSVPQVTDQQASQFIAEIQAPSYKAQIVQDSHWVQPTNKSQACKVNMVETAEHGRWWEGPGANLAWDGECRNGFAYGLGREFVDSPFAGLMASIATYPGGEVEPKYVQSSQFDKGILAFGDLEASKGMSIATRRTPAGFEMMTVLFGKDGEVQYARQETLGGPGVRYAKGYANGHYAFMLTEVKDPQNQLSFTMVVTKDGKEVGYRVQKWKNGVIQGVSNVGPQPQIVQLPQSLLTFFDDQVRDIQRALAEGQSSYQEALVTVERYKRSVCGVRKDVKFVSADTYYQICSEHGDLTPYQDGIAEINQRIRDRQIAQAAEDDRLARLAQANAQIQAQQTAQLTQSLNQFSNSMNSYSQSMLDTVNSNNQQMMQRTNQGFQYQPETYQTRCLKTGNLVNCQTQ